MNHDSESKKDIGKAPTEVKSENKKLESKKEGKSKPNQTAKPKKSCDRGLNGVTFIASVGKGKGKYICNKCKKSIGEVWPDPIYGIGVGPCMEK